jgi:hypothetical protein
MDVRKQKVMAVLHGRRYSQQTAIGLLFLMAMLALTPGCATSDWFLTAGAADKSSQEIRQVVATWHNQVIFGPDPTRGGQQVPALGGRIYLFGPELGVPLQGNGKLVVQLHALPPDKPQGPLALLEEWIFDPDTLRLRCLRQDMVGWGYTIFLPWSTYRPDISQVQLKVRYEDGKGLPVYAEGGPITLNSGQDALAIVRRSQQTKGPVPAVAAKPDNPTMQPTGAIQAPAPQAGPMAAVPGIPGR